MNLTDAELTELLDDLESDRAERKESFRGDAPEKVRQAVCAFANDLPNHRRPGVVFIGVRDEGSPAGLVVTDDLLLKLADIRSDGNIQPLPSMTVQKHRLKGSEMAVITVQPADAPPVDYKGRIYIRTGPRRDIANRQDLRILNERRRHRDLPFDIQPVSFADISDLYPLAALQQLVRNAVMHRTYEATNAPIRVNWFIDRIEILNPGGAFGMVTRENFGAPGVTDYRNPNLAQAMKVLGYVQRFGVGIALARRLLAENGNPPPVFEVRDTHVLVTVRESS